jgi:hypothetical protein
MNGEALVRHVLEEEEEEEDDLDCLGEGLSKAGDCAQCDASDDACVCIWASSSSSSHLPI